jgi:hypothetical protein
MPSPRTSSSARARTAVLLILALLAGTLAGVAIDRGAGPASAPEPVATADTAPFGRFDQSDRSAHLGQPAPLFVLTDHDGDRVEVRGDDGRPKVLLLTRPDCPACDLTVAELADHLARSEYDPATSRYDLLVVTTGELAERTGWPHRSASFQGGPELLTDAGFTPDQLPAWFFTYPDGTLAGRELGGLSYDQYRRITTLLAATIP